MHEVARAELRQLVRRRYGHQRIGRVKMRIAVIADIHGNVLALQAVPRTSPGVAAPTSSSIWGDCVSGPLWPRETVERLMSLDWPTVRGNHDRRVALDLA